MVRKVWYNEGQERRKENTMSCYDMKTMVLSSLEKVFPEIDPEEDKRREGFSCLDNEPLSFQQES